jgi:hypothetical protein
MDAYLALRRLEAECRGDPDYLKGVVGISRPGQIYMLSVWQDRAGTRRMLGSPQLRKLTERHPGAWANEWLPENEFGHWDGLRLRRARARYAIQMPKAAMDLDKGSVAEAPRQPQPRRTQPSQG